MRLKSALLIKTVEMIRVYTTYPTDVFIHKYLEPIYETVPGWKNSISSIRKYEDLPENAKKYIEKVEDLIGAPIGIISVSAQIESRQYSDKKITGFTIRLFFIL